MSVAGELKQGCRPRKIKVKSGVAGFTKLPWLLLLGPGDVCQLSGWYFQILG